MKKNMTIASICILLSPSAPVFAHVGLETAEGFVFGLQHPLLGLDHFLVMTGLGLWLSRQNRDYGLRGITAFLAAMGVGAVSAMSGWYFPYVETAILLSVLLTGVLLIGSGERPAGNIGIAAITALAFMHGQAHGSEIPLHTAVLSYCGGFLLATLALLVAGSACGWLLRRKRYGSLSRIYGGLTGMAGLWLLLLNS